MVQWPLQGRRRSGDGVVALPAAAASFSDRVRVLRRGIVAADEPRILSRQSPPPLYRLRDGGLPASSWAGPPIRARGQGTSWPLGQLVEINSNILSLDLLLYFHIHIFYFFLYFITD